MMIAVVVLSTIISIWRVIITIRLTRNVRKLKARIEALESGR